MNHARVTSLAAFASDHVSCMGFDASAFDHDEAHIMCLSPLRDLFVQTARLASLMSDTYALDCKSTQEPP